MRTIEDVNRELERLNGAPLRGEHEQMISKALGHLRLARTLLQQAQAKRALARVNLAISSTKGAERNARSFGR